MLAVEVMRAATRGELYGINLSPTASEYIGER